MKANEAPEKIYLQDSMSTDTIGDLWPEWFDAKVSDDSIEYTRTDAFIEKAEELAKKYCEGSSFEDACMERPAYIAGYHQAEKDNELTWEDISKIISIDQQVCGNIGISDYTHNHQQAMKEVLKRFKDFKK